MMALGSLVGNGGVTNTSRHVDSLSKVPWFVQGIYSK